MRSRPTVRLALALYAMIAAGCLYTLDRERPGSASDGSPIGDGGADAPHGADQRALTDAYADLPLPIPQTTLLQAVADSLVLPSDSEDFARDLDGDGHTDNQLGAILSVLKTVAPELDLQPALDSDVADGSSLVLIELLASSYASSAARVKADEGLDGDSNPADNFSGSEPLSIAPASPAGTLDGVIHNGQLRATGTFLLPLTVEGKRHVLTLELARIEATASAAGITEGLVAGALPIEQVRTAVVPEIAGKLDDTYNNPATDAAMVKKLDDIFDQNDDGKISVAEVENNSLIGLLIAPDVDINGNGQKDGLSAGIGFSAVPCVIQR